MIRLSVTARIALLSISLALVSNLALVGFVWKTTSADAIYAIRRETTEQSEALRAVWRNGGLPAVRQAIDSAVVPGDVSLVLAVIDPKGRAVVGISPAPSRAPVVRSRSARANSTCSNFSRVMRGRSSRGR